MKRRASAWAVAVSILLLVAYVGTRPLRPAPRFSADETVVVYSTERPEVTLPFQIEFEKTRGGRIDVRLFDTPKKLIDRLIAERHKPVADVVIASDSATLVHAEARGLLEPAHMPHSDRIRPIYRSASGAWQAFMGRPWVIVYDPSKMLEFEAPQSVFEIARPKKGQRCGFPDPNFPPMREFAETLRRLFGEVATDALFSDALKNGALVGPSSAAIVDQVTSGRIAWGIAESDAAYERQRADKRVKWVVPDQHPLMPRNRIGAMLVLTAAGVPSGRRKSAVTAAFVEFLCSSDRAGLVGNLTPPRFSLHTPRPNAARLPLVAMDIEYDPNLRRTVGRR